MEKGLKIDTKYYIENQILPPIERLFEAVGIKRSAIFSSGRQTSLSLISIQKNGFTVESLEQEKIEKECEVKELTDFENFVCKKCGRIYFSLPFSTKCYDCNGDVAFNLNGLVSMLVRKSI